MKPFQRLPPKTTAQFLIHAMAALLAAIIGVSGAAAESTRPASAGSPLQWDALEKRAEARVGETSAIFLFTVTNTGRETVVIENVEPSCGCTAAELPSSPWRLAPAEAGTLRLTIDFAGKSGDLVKTAVVHSSVSDQTLTMRLKIAGMSAADRETNRQLAQQHRQAVFNNDCARCHAAPAVGKKGAELFTVVCAICHLAAHRAEAVPDLASSKTTPRDAAYWHGMIAEGRAASLMPAFAQSRGGPLSEIQITSLVDYLLHAYPERATAAMTAPAEHRDAP